MVVFSNDGRRKKIIKIICEMRGVIVVARVEEIFVNV